MKIDARIALAAGDKTHSVEPRDQTAWQLAWRRELEKAQRFQAQQGENQVNYERGQRPSIDGDVPPALSATAPAGDVEGSVTPDFKAVNQAHVASGSALPSAVAGSNPVSRAADAAFEPLLRPVATSVSAFDFPETPAQAPQSKPAASVDALIARMQRLDWMPQAAHVSLQGNGVSVALRDARLSEQDVRELHSRMRREMQSLGLELAELVVNGHLVRPADE